jgi:hypothetical protein|tara:strand:- start:16 stop:321 length:306 start_codon:yes stop_codon:yes gene_type:complete
MSHFAKIKDGIVQQVIVAEQDVIDSGSMGDPTDWVQTSYNTYRGIHYTPNNHKLPDGGIPLRKNYASKGHTYDEERDAFYAPQPDPSWVLNEETCIWEPPQ